MGMIDWLTSPWGIEAERRPEARFPMGMLFYYYEKADPQLYAHNRLSDNSIHCHFIP